MEPTERDLRRWADERGEKLDGQGTRILLELMRDELDLQGPGELTPEKLRTLMLEVFPELVAAWSDDVPTVLTALRGIVAYLRDSGTVTAPDAAALETEIDRIAPEFAEIVGDFDDDEQRAAAEVVAGLMQSDGVAVDDPEAVEKWVREFENLPEAERFARTEEYLREVEERVVPPVRIAAEAELAAAARASRLTAAVVALAEWTGERDLTEHETLADADAAPPAASSACRSRTGRTAAATPWSGSGGRRRPPRRSRSRAAAPRPARRWPGCGPGTTPSCSARGCRCSTPSWCPSTTTRTASTRTSWCRTR
ncbi:hypothetical protein BJF79_29030 [Actinomadura sp. CNU-125]|nr:hypothetical protein BJF79_29030 [Actinomadura sp. CNU-125]